jgi:Ion channel
VSAILALSIFIIAYLLRIYEIVYYRAIGWLDFEQFICSIWAVVITMATVGFGDIVPVSHIGRVIIMITSIWGTFIFTLVIVAFSAVFNLSAHQKKAMHHLLLTRKAASTLTSAFRYFTAKRNFREKNRENPLYKEVL